MTSHPYTVGCKVRRKSDGVCGIVTEITDREVVVQYSPTHRTEATPWGPWTDTKGVTGHHYIAHLDRLITPANP